MRKIFSCTAYALFSASIAFAQAPKASISITEPQDGVEISTLSTMVRGDVQNLPADGHIWVLVQPEGINTWYIQGEGERRKTGQDKWSCDVYLGERISLHNKGYTIMAIIVNDSDNQILKNALQRKDKDVDDITFENLGKYAQEEIAVKRQLR